jgi:hypothetical protein
MGEMYRAKDTKLATIKVLPEYSIFHFASLEWAEGRTLGVAADSSHGAEQVPPDKSATRHVAWLDQISRLDY